MTRFLALALSALLPVQAAALSCMRPDAKRTFAELAEVPEPYVLVVGTITFDENLLPRTDHRFLPKAHNDLPARLTGKALSGNGFTAPYARTITLDARCFAGWCGGLPSGTRILAFVERRAGGDRLSIDPCGGHAFPDPPARVLKQMQTCMSGGPCRADGVEFE